MRIWSVGAMILAGALLSHQPAEGGPGRPSQITYDRKLYYFYPQVYDRRPDMPSPFTTENGIEIAVVGTKLERYTVFDVTVENGDSLNYKSGKNGCGLQTKVDTADFPTLAATGLHSELELARTTAITGKAVADITERGRPEMSSEAGFMAGDEAIISVLAGDNLLVGRLGLTHPQLARPLFHLWNIIRAHEIVCNRKDGSEQKLDWLSYNGRRVYFGAGSGHGWQESIFDDEILGMFQLEMWCSLTDSETALLKKEYPNLTESQMQELIRQLTYIHTGEMVPYYIMRYGFYEGHTSYRADPIVVAFMFGLRTLDEIERAFDGVLPDALARHHTPVKASRQPQR